MNSVLFGHHIDMQILHPFYWSFFSNAFQYNTWQSFSTHGLCQSRKHFLQSPNVSPLTSLLVTFISLRALSLALQPFYPTSPPHPLAYPPSPTLYLAQPICYPPSQSLLSQLASPLPPPSYQPSPINTFCGSCIRCWIYQCYKQRQRHRKNTNKDMAFIWTVPVFQTKDVENQTPILGAPLCNAITDFCTSKCVTVPGCMMMIGLITAR